MYSVCVSYKEKVHLLLTGYYSSAGSFLRLCHRPSIYKDNWDKTEQGADDALNLRIFHRRGRSPAFVRMFYSSDTYRIQSHSSRDCDESEDNDSDY